MKRLAALALFVLTACAPWVDAPGTLGMRNVVDAPGSQRAIDNGAVVNWNGCDPGQCTVHLAGHRTQAGGTFRSVPNIDVGDWVRYGWGGDIYHLTVVDIEDFCGSSYDFWAYLTLQTTLPGGCVRFVHTELDWVQDL
jgi:hypothetical protein